MKIRIVLVVLLALSNVTPASEVSSYATSPTLKASATVSVKPRVTLQDLVSIKSLDVSLQVSPNGRTLAYALNDESLWIARTESGGIARRVGTGFLPTWSPDGEQLAFYSVGPDGIQLWVHNLEAGISSQVTNIAGGIDPDPTSRVGGWIRDAFRYGWSPNGRQLVFTSRVPVRARVDQFGQGTSSAPSNPSDAVSGPVVLTTTTPPSWTDAGIFAQPSVAMESVESKDGRTLSPKSVQPGVSKFNNQLFVATLATRTVRRLTDDSSSYFHPQWSVYGANIICALSESGGSLSGAEATSIAIVNVRTGTVTKKFDGPGLKYDPQWHPNGKGISYLQRKGKFSHATIVVAEDYDSPAQTLAAGFDRHIFEYAWAPDGRSIWVIYKNGVSIPVGKISVRSGTVEPVEQANSSGPVVASALTVSLDGSVAYLKKDPADAGSIQYIHSGKGSSSILIDLQPEMKAWQLGRAEIVRWKNKRGDEMEGTLLKPVGFQEGYSYPLIVDVYPLSNGAEWTSPLGGNHAWASLGYAVFQASPRAPHAWMNPWKAEAFSLAGKGPEGWAVAVDDVISGVDALIQGGVVDESRMCLFGFSNGGGVVNYLITATNRFKCAVSIAPAAVDWIRPALLQTNSSWISEFAGATVWEDPFAYVRLSPAFRVQFAETPLLLAAGDNDGGFLLDAIEMYNGLRNAGKDVVLLRYPNQGHGFTGTALEDFWVRQMEFFAKYLKPGSHTSIDNTDTRSIANCVDQPCMPRTIH